MLNAVFFFQTRICLFVYYELNASSDEDFSIQTMILNFTFVLQEIQIHQSFFDDCCKVFPVTEIQKAL